MNKDHIRFRLLREEDVKEGNFVIMASVMVKQPGSIGQLMPVPVAGQIEVLNDEDGQWYNIVIVSAKPLQEMSEKRILSA